VNEYDSLVFWAFRIGGETCGRPVRPRSGRASRGGCVLIDAVTWPSAMAGTRATGGPRGGRDEGRCERSIPVKVLIVVVIVVVVVLLLVLALAVRIVKQYEQGVLFRLGRVRGAREPGLRLIIPLVDVMRRVSMRIVTMPIQSQGIITRDNVSVDVSAVAYFRVVDAVKSVVAIENVRAAIDQIAQTTLRKVVGQHTLDQTLSETDRINLDIREILDVTTVGWGVEVSLVELKDIQLPESMKRAMARQAEAEREKRAKIISAEGESMAAAALGEASDTMMAHPLALQLRNLQSLVEIGVDKNSTVVFPAPLMTTIAELGSFLAREQRAAAPVLPPNGGASAATAPAADGPPHASPNRT
jgi:regulator of protease activity HflC (stomatin/prohibitin superfamily)